MDDVAMILWKNNNKRTGDGGGIVILEMMGEENQENSSGKVDLYPGKLFSSHLRGRPSCFLVVFQ